MEKNYKIWRYYSGKVQFDNNTKDAFSLIDCLVPEPQNEGNNTNFNAKKFIKDYKDFYFLNRKVNVDYEKKTKKVDSRNQSSVDVEDMFFEGENAIIKKETWGPEDVFNILAWKTENIIHNKSNREKIIYKNGWNINISENNQKQFELMLRSYSLKNKEFYDLVGSINEIRKKYKYKEEYNIDNAWHDLLVASDKINGLGTVYLITLLFFITNGECPIYDRFAMAALIALLVKENAQCDLFAEGVIRKTTLPEKKNIQGKSLSEIILYNNYIQLLCHFFGEDWKGNRKGYRDIDRALWVYGHYFDVPQ